MRKKITYGLFKGGNMLNNPRKVNPGKKMRGSDSTYSKLNEESEEVLSKGGDCEK
jgi:hypothetical protein